MSSARSKFPSFLDRRGLRKSIDGPLAYGLWYWRLRHTRTSKWRSQWHFPGYTMENMVFFGDVGKDVFRDLMQETWIFWRTIGIFCFILQHPIQTSKQKQVASIILGTKYLVVKSMVSTVQHVHIAIDCQPSVSKQPQIMEVTQLSPTWNIQLFVGAFPGISQS